MIRRVDDLIAPEHDFPPEVRAAARAQMLELAGRYPDSGTDPEQLEERRVEAERRLENAQFRLAEDGLNPVEEMRLEDHVIEARRELERLERAAAAVAQQRAAAQPDPPSQSYRQQPRWRSVESGVSQQRHT